MNNYDAVKVKAVPIGNVVKRLGIELPPEKYGRIMISCPLPGHEDKKPSLDIKPADNVFYCHGCHAGGSAIDFVMQIKGMEFQDACNWIGEAFNLDPDLRFDGKDADKPPGPHGADPQGDAPFPEGSTDTPPDPVQEKILDPKPPVKQNGSPGATYDYSDVDGNLIYQVKRTADKSFIQRRPKDSGWVWNLDGITRLPYRLPGLVKADPVYDVYIVEGEKDADRLSNYGIIATCNSGGTGNWESDLNQYFKGRSVVIIPDNDPPGKDHAVNVATQLDGIADTIRILELPGLPDKGDVSDWLDAGGGVANLKQLAIECEKWVYRESEKEPIEGELSKADYAGMFYGAYDLLKGMQASPEAIGFCFPGANGEKLDDTAPLLPGTLNVIMGRPGHGKTTFMINAALNMAAAYPDNAFIYLTFEETPAHLAHKMLRPLSALNVFLDTPDSNIGFPRLRTICNDLDDLSYDGFVKRLSEDSPLNCPPNVWKAWAEFHRLTSDVDGQGPQIILLDGHAFTRGHAINLETITSIVGFHRDSPDLKPIGAIFFDYAQKIPWQPRETKRGKAMSRQQELADISEMLLRSAKDNNIPLVAGAQVNREVKAHKPSKGNGVQSVPDGSALTLDKLREAGDFEQDAFLVIGLWHGELSACEMARGDERIAPAGNCELLVKVLKNRGGEVGNYDFCFNVTTGLITGDLVSEIGNSNEGVTQEDLSGESF